MNNYKDNPLLDRIRAYKCNDKLCSYIMRWILGNLQDKLNLLTFLNEVMDNWCESTIHIIVSDQFPDRYNDLDDIKKEAMLSVDNQIIKDFYDIYQSDIKHHLNELDKLTWRTLKEYDWYKRDCTCFAVNKIVRGMCMNLYA